MMPLFMPGPLPKLLPALPQVQQVSEWFPMYCHPCRPGYYRLRHVSGDTERFYYDPVMDAWTVPDSSGVVAETVSSAEMVARGYESWQGLLK